MTVHDKRELQFLPQMIGQRAHVWREMTVHGYLPGDHPFVKLLYHSSYIPTFRMAPERKV